MGNKWLDSRYFLKVESIGFLDRLNMRCKREEWRMTIRIFTRAVERMGLVFTKTESFIEEGDLGYAYQEHHFG